MRNLSNALRLIFLGAVVVVIMVLLKVPARSPKESTPLAYIPSETTAVPPRMIPPNH